MLTIIGNRHDVVLLLTIIMTIKTTSGVQMQEQPKSSIRKQSVHRVSDTNSKKTSLRLHQMPSTVKISKVTKSFVKRLMKDEKKQIVKKLTIAYGSGYKGSKQYLSVSRSCRKKSQNSFINFHDGSAYRTNPLHLCSGGPDILIAVHSQSEKFARRQIIRETFGSIKNVHGKKIVVVFFLGLSKINAIQKLVKDEIDTHQDIVLKEFMEDGQNITYKHLAVYDWTMQFCNKIKYLVKIDDTTFINIFHLVSYINTFNPNGFYCSRTIDSKPITRKGKMKDYYKKYEYQHFPHYCKGFGYILKASFIQDLYVCSLFHHYLWIDDIFVGGILRDAMNIPINGFMKGYDMAYSVPSLASYQIADHIFYVPPSDVVLPSVTQKMWQASFLYSY